MLFDRITLNFRLIPEYYHWRVFLMFYAFHFAFHSTYFVHTSAHRASYRSRARFISTRHIAHRTDERLVRIIIYAASFASHGRVFAFPRRFAGRTSPSRTEPRAVLHVVCATADASHFAFHSLSYVFPFVASSPEALAALLRVRRDGEAPA
jgi:hypothetical protein